MTVPEPTEANVEALAHELMAADPMTFRLRMLELVTQRYNPESASFFGRAFGMWNIPDGRVMGPLASRGLQVRDTLLPPLKAWVEQQPDP